MLAGIALVVDDIRRGPKLVFRYPSTGFWDQFTAKTPASAGGVETSKLHATKAGGSGPTPSTESAPLSVLPLQSAASGILSSSTESGVLQPMAAVPTPSSAPPLTSSPSTGGEEEEYNDVFARLFRPKAALIDDCFEVRIDGLHFVSFPTSVSESDRKPVLWNAALPSEVDISAAAPLEEWVKRAESRTDRHEISLFNVVIAMDVRGSDSDTADTELAASVRAVLTNLRNCLMHEQRRVRYISTEVRTLQDVRERCEGGAGLLQAQLTSSRLATELAALFDGLSTHAVAHIHINRWIRLSASLASLPSAGAEGEGAVFPYHSVLLKEGKEALHKCLPVDASPQLRRLIDAASPVKSLSQLQVETGMEMNQVLLLAAHLRRWGKADIICQIVPSTVVRVCASAPIGPPHGNPLAARFNDTFPDQPNYHKMLHLLSQGQPLQRLLPATMVAQRTFLEAVVWLLQERVVEQLLTFVHLVLPVTFTSPARQVMGADTGPLTPAEVRCLEGYERLLRLGQYFRGRTHTVHIAWAIAVEEDTLMSGESGDSASAGLDELFKEFRGLLVLSDRPG